MKRLNAFMLLCLACLGLCLAGCDSLKKEQSESSSAMVPSLGVGKQAPDVEMVAFDGSKLSLADLKGKKVYINVWGSWCGPCLMEMPELEKLYQEYKDKEDWVFLSLVTPSDKELGNKMTRDGSKEDIMAVANDKGISYPVYFDQNDLFMTAFAVRAFPSHILINSDGTIASYSMGSLTKEALQAVFEKVS